jgi:hypothetical protein
MDSSLLAVCRLKAAKRRARELAQALNSCKVRLDEARSQQEQAKQARLAAGQEPQEVRGCSQQVVWLAAAEPQQYCHAEHAASAMLVLHTMCA